MRPALLLLLFAALLIRAESSGAGWAICTYYGDGATSCDPHLAATIWAYQLNTCIVENDGPSLGVSDTIYTYDGKAVTLQFYNNNQCNGTFSPGYVWPIGCNYNQYQNAYWSCEYADSFALSDYAPAGSLTFTWFKFPSPANCAGTPVQYLIQPPKVCSGNQMFWCNATVWWTQNYQDAACQHVSQPAYTIPWTCGKGHYATLGACAQ